ncbi:glycine zipper 2TM domain-containing protein [Pseudofulvimonas gallinarii]|jgi:uncharacterized protein YcfJ|uniref:Uncharacterized protein YcfJ n=1 Tax=Pseudofulvimonas gallinarii TaxID=634155 RepID=A0A4R3LHW5_9GAMM|nr:glycine zipper 2TM domain-containing protein [Pseudofulvimonas gallinarii]TCS99702.1 uncharacterized protein YcfJ [Pseudofulvimonas gallinarii]
MRILFGLAVSLGVAASASAYDNGYAYDRPADGYGSNVHYAYGEVLEVQPVHRTSHYPTSRQVCQDEPVEYYEAGRPRSPAGTVVGAIIGGVIGNQIGRHGHGHYRHHHRDASTAAGAAIGAAIGYGASRDGGYVRRGYEQRCYEERGYESAQEVVGYDVTYRYRGEIYQTRTEQHPGDTIRVRVAVEAIH